MAQRVVIITGAGGGIGRATAVEMARRGDRAILVGRNESRLRETQQLASGSHVIVADVTRVTDVESLVSETLSQSGRIDALVNNAGVAPVLSIEQTTPEIWHDVLNTNLSAAFYLCRSVWPTFKRQRGGVVVNISSRSARDPFAGFLAYGAAKAGLNNLGLSLAREGSAIGVRVHTLALGAVETPMFRNILSPEQFPRENTLDPAEVAQVIARCIIGEELRYTSGEVIWLSKLP